MIDRFDCWQLAAHLCGMDPDEVEDVDDVWDALDEKYDIDRDEFINLICDLVPLIDVGKSELTGKKYKGFSKILKPGLVETLVKVEIGE